MNPDKPQEPFGNRPVLFAPGSDPGRRRRRTIFVAIYLLAGLMVIWPVFPLFAGIFPLILGLPLSLAWVVLALVLMFCALVWLYRSENDADGGAG